MLEKLLELDLSYFPDDEDPSIYSRIEYFFYRHQLRCCSCTHPFSGEDRDIICTLCMKDEIIKEELRLPVGNPGHFLETCSNKLFLCKMNTHLCIHLLYLRLETSNSV